MVQGGVRGDSRHLNEPLSPGPVRAVLPGVACISWGICRFWRNGHFQAAVAQSMFFVAVCAGDGLDGMFCAVFIAVVASFTRGTRRRSVWGREHVATVGEVISPSKDKGDEMRRQGTEHRNWYRRSRT